jgi:MyTH4 domain
MQAFWHLQLLKQTRGSAAGLQTVRAWQLFYLLACLAPPGRAFVALVCEYVHSAGAAGALGAPGEARDWAVKDLGCAQALDQVRAAAPGAQHALPCSSNEIAGNRSF